MGNDDGQIDVEDFRAQMINLCGEIEKADDRELLNYACIILAGERAIQTRVVVLFRDRRLGEKSVGLDKKSAKSLVIFATFCGQPSHAWQKRKKPEIKEDLPSLLKEETVLLCADLIKTLVREIAMRAILKKLGLS